LVCGTGLLYYGKAHTNVMHVRNKAGFTLIELMIVVAVLGILAAIAIPSFVSFIRRSKTVEATDQLKNMFTRAAVYYARDHSGSGMSTTTMTACTVGSADNKIDPSSQKQQGDYTDSSFSALSLNIRSATYFRYEIESIGGGSRCNVPSSTEIYHLRARGDLDGDGERSLFELATASNSDNELFHARSFYVSSETE
jgi:type IV pilus assembly protein PilA